MDRESTYKIDELFGEAWECGIKNAIVIINKRLRTDYSFVNDKSMIEMLLYGLNVRFDVNGEIVERRL